MAPIHLAKIDRTRSTRYEETIAKTANWSRTYKNNGFRLKLLHDDLVCYTAYSLTVPRAR